MSHDEFTKLFKYMQGIKGEMDAKFGELKADINRLHNLLDADLKAKETDE